jgi:tyrosyl-tRNA synthetase
MSKSLNNYVGVMEPADEMFGKLMSISDDLMWQYYLLLTDLPEAEIDGLKRQVTAGEAHPKAAKAALARRIVADFHGGPAADEAAVRFDARARGESTGDEPVLEWVLSPAPKTMRQLMIELKLAASGREADQKLDQGAVSVDGRRVGGKLEPQSQYLVAGREHRLTIGRRAYRLKVRPE